ncbi:Crp/Fnr family transcriptional regulator [Aneurinibacillus terranovensis]|uniref:Crp/Fnr family transcriptional regulator n=1 Tax=Aneurinibacillus terranovensis TaxID=278991 RepID=UPI0004073165|nr:Crp/Fnr family transcriptional regulator [Aneurinibacillus terranovensis]
MAENGKRYSQAIYKKGDFIGELEIFDKKPFVCFVEALTDITVIKIKSQYFHQWIELDRTISNFINRTLCNQFYDLSRKAGDDNLYSLRHRICNYLLTCLREGKQVTLL